METRLVHFSLVAPEAAWPRRAWTRAGCREVRLAPSVLRAVSVLGAVSGVKLVGIVLCDRGISLTGRDNRLCHIFMRSGQTYGVDLVRGRSRRWHAITATIWPEAFWPSDSSHSPAADRSTGQRPPRRWDGTRM